MKELKGSVTLFVSMCLGGFIVLFTTLTAICIYYSEHVRFEGAYDMAMNSALGEYSVALLKEYGLLYVDTSYLTMEPSIDNLCSHVRQYFQENTIYSMGSDHGPWGTIDVSSCEITDFQTATANRGESMRYQACRYSDINELYSQYADEINEVYESGDISILDNPYDVLGEWGGIMGQIAQMELPTKLNEETGEEEEVPVNNPADWAYGLAGSDVLYLAEVSLGSLSGYEIVNDALTSTDHINIETMAEIKDMDEDAFYAYLLDMLGCKDSVRHFYPISLELEYVINGGISDFENIKSVAQRIFMARLSDNVGLAKADGGLNAAAYEIAAALEVCTLSPEFIEPVAKSIVYAVAFLETVSDIHSIFNGGRVPLHKESLGLSVDDLLGGELVYLCTDSGLTYRQYLLGMIMLLDEENLNYRVMDIMEIFIRSNTGNSYFSMDWCVERFRLKAAAVNSMSGGMVIDRVYGIF